MTNKLRSITKSNQGNDTPLKPWYNNCCILWSCYCKSVSGGGKKSMAFQFGFSPRAYDHELKLITACVH